MNKNNLLLGLFGLQLLALAVPGFRDHYVRSRGERFQLAVQPVDPRDLMRGRYVALDFKIAEQIREQGDAACAGRDDDYFSRRHHFYRGPTKAALYVGLRVGRDGLAEVASVGTTQPEGAHYLRLRDYRCYDKKLQRVELPFNRFYANEKLAPALEAAVADRDARLMVHIHNGFYAVEDLALLPKAPTPSPSPTP
jgi:hypothetical protein